MNIQHSWWLTRSFQTFLKGVILIGLLGLVIFKIRFAAVRVDAHTVGKGQVVAEVMGTGTLGAKLDTTISPRIQEQLVDVMVDQGDRVQAGQLLAKLDDSELRQVVAVAEASLDAAQATAERVSIDEARAEAVEEQARQDYQRVSDLLQSGVSSQADRDKALEQLRVAESDLRSAHAATIEAARRVVTAEKNLAFERERLGYTRVVSPYDGLIVRRDRDPGDVVVPGSSILQLISTDELWLSAWVGETLMAQLSTGQTARVVFRSEPSHHYQGTVVRLGRQVDRETREFIVDVKVDELPGNWAVGQRGEVYVEIGRASSALLVPREFLAWKNGKPGVFVDQAGQAHWRALSLGLTGEKVVQVVDGLTEGETLVRLPQGRREPLRDGQRVKHS